MSKTSIAGALGNDALSIPEVLRAKIIAAGGNPNGSYNIAELVQMLPDGGDVTPTPAESGAKVYTLHGTGGESVDASDIPTISRHSFPSFNSNDEAEISIIARGKLVGVTDGDNTTELSAINFSVVFLSQYSSTVVMSFYNNDPAYTFTLHYDTSNKTFTLAEFTMSGGDEGEAGIDYMSADPTEYSVSECYVEWTVTIFDNRGN